MMAKQDVTVELRYDQQWHDVTALGDVRAIQPITIVRGSASGESELQPATAHVMLDNRDARYSLRNPTSPLYGKIGRNTPLRVYLGTPHGAATNVDLVDTTDHVAPSVDAPTADGLLICAWAAPSGTGLYSSLPGSMTIGPSTGDTLTEVASAYETISAAGATGTRTATFSESEDYLAASVLVHGTSVTPVLVSGLSTLLVSISATAGNWWVIVSYQSWFVTEDLATPEFPRDTDGGGWILLADTGTLQPGDPDATFFRMKVWAKQVKTSGTHTIWVDNPGSLLASVQSVFFELSGVGAWSPRFVGEVAQWPVGASAGGHDVTVSVEAADITRRIRRERSSTADTVARLVDRYRDVCIAYWPMSDPDGATFNVSGIGGRPMQPNRSSLGQLAFEAPQFGGGRFPEPMPAGIATNGALGSTDGAVSSTATEGGWVVDFRWRAPHPATWGTDHPQRVTFTMRDDGGFVDDFGTEWQVSLRASQEEIGLVIDGSAGQQSTTLDMPVSMLDGQPHHVRVRAFEQSGNGGALFVDVDGVPVGSLLHTDIGTASIRPLLSVTVGWSVVVSTEVLPVSIGQITAWREPVPGLVDVYAAYNEHRGETPSQRIGRVCREERIPHAIVGDTASEEVLLGPQFPESVVDILADAAKAGGGWIYTAREFAGICYRVPTYNGPVVLSQSAAAGGIGPLLPVPDDQQTANVVTATARAGSANARSVQESGPLNVELSEDDPDGIGPVPRPISPNVLPSLIVRQADWARHLGTQTDDRFPAIVFDLVAASSALRDQVEALDVADRSVITSPPPWLGPDAVDLLLQGYIEVIGTHTRTVTANALPAAPFRIAEVEHDDYAIIGSDRSTLIFDFVAGTETAMFVDVSDNVDLRWDGAEVPFDILVGGVRLTVTAVAAFGSIDQEFTVTQTPVNGVTKTIPAGTKVDVFHKSYIGL